MKIHHAALVAPVILLAFISAPSPADGQQRQSRALAGFDAIEVGGHIDLFVRRGDGFVVEVEAPEGDAAKVLTEVIDGTLQVGREKSFDWGDLGSVHITLPGLVSLVASSTSDVATEGKFASDNLRIVASGGTDVTIDVAVGALDIEASGRSDLRLSGSARSARVRSSGSSNLNASRLTTDEADIETRDAAYVSIVVRQKLVADASGVSGIRYSGEPGSVSVYTRGGAAIRRR
jgi:hypothetical protein